jgi:hypothetical protein
MFCGRFAGKLTMQETAAVTNKFEGLDIEDGDNTTQ